MRKWYLIFWCMRHAINKIGTHSHAECLHSISHVNMLGMNIHRSTLVWVKEMSALINFFFTNFIRLKMVLLMLSLSLSLALGVIFRWFWSSKWMIDETGFAFNSVFLSLCQRISACVMFVKNIWERTRDVHTLHTYSFFLSTPFYQTFQNQ